MATNDFKLAVIKLESYNAYLLKLGGNLSCEISNYLHFLQKCGLKYMPISQIFNTYLK